jgi:hypothetical protein
MVPFKKVVDLSLWRYVIRGAMRRFRNTPSCPCCGSEPSNVVDQKLFHTLHKCSGCKILFRFPAETSDTMEHFYQENYAEPGLTTLLPSIQELENLKRNSFRGSEKDFTYHISILGALGLEPGSSILDYGANWGYLTYLLRQAGYRAEGYEISKHRASYAGRLGVEIFTEITHIRNRYDAVYSSHVLEHVSNPLAVLRQQLDWTKDGGLVIAHTPNGSLARSLANPRGFHLSWGRVHPFLLTDEFIRHNFGTDPYYISSHDSPETVHRWKRSQKLLGDTSGDGLFFVLTKPISEEVS